MNIWGLYPLPNLNVSNRNKSDERYKAFLTIDSKVCLLIKFDFELGCQTF